MKYKIIAYITSVIAAIALCITALLGFKLINYKSVLENSGEDSVIVIKAFDEKDKLILERSYFDVFGENLYSVINEDKDFVVNPTGFVESILNIQNVKGDHSWMIYSSTHNDCKNNTQITNSCMNGSTGMYLSNVNEFTFRYEKEGK